MLRLWLNLRVLSPKFDFPFMWLPQLLSIWWNSKVYAYSPKSWWLSSKSPADRSMAHHLFSLQNFSFHFEIVFIPATCMKNFCYPMPSRQCGVPPFGICKYVTSQFTYAKPSSSAVWPWWHWIGWYSSNILDFYLEGARFEPQMRHRCSDRGVLWFSSVPTVVLVSTWIKP
jgi:hypothetical protein